jgi:hypothetical protein
LKFGTVELEGKSKHGRPGFPVQPLIGKKQSPLAIIKMFV